MDSKRLITTIATLIGITFVMSLFNRAHAATSLPSSTAVYGVSVHAPFGQAKTISSRGVVALKSEEGFRPKAYPDAGKLSIGYGHQIIPGDGLSALTVLTPEAASLLMMKDIAAREKIWVPLVRVPMSQGMVDALNSLVYNIGTGAFAKSMLLVKLNSGDYTGARNEFATFNKTGGKVSAVLTGRRAREANLFTTG